MRLISLELNNILCFPSAELALDNRGVLLVNGENGAGKSSLSAKAICWTIFGRTPGGARSDALASNVADGPAVSNLALEVRGVRYDIERSRRPARLTLRREGEDISSRSSAETQALIESTLGRDIDTFLSTDYFGQDLKSSFLSSPPTYQLSVLESILRLDEVDRLAQNAKNKKSELDEQVSELTDERSSLRGQHSALSTQLESSRKSCEQRVQELAQLKRELESERVENVEQQLEQAQARLRAAQDGLSEVQAERQRLDAEESRCITRAREHFAEQLEPLRQREIEEKSRLERAKERLAEHRTPTDDSRGRLRLLDRVIAKGVNLSARNEARHQIVATQTTLAGLEARLCPVADKICPTCSQPVTSEITEKLRAKQADIMAQVEEQRQKLETLRDEYKCAQQTVDRHQQRLERFRERRERLAEAVTGEAEQSRTRLQQEVRAAEECLAETRKSILDLETQVSAYATELKEEVLVTGMRLASRKQELTEEVNALHPNIQRLEAAQRMEMRLDVQIREIERTVNELLMSQEELAAQIEQIEQTGRGVAQKLQEAEQAAQDLSFWVRELGRPFKSFLIRRALPILEQRANSHLQSLGCSNLQIRLSASTETAKGEQRAVISAAALSKGSSSYGCLSGGERQIVDFAMGQALGELADARIGSPSNIMILDEPFTELDEERSRRLVDYILSDLSARKSSVLLISNDSRLKSLIQNQITVVRDDSGVSQVV